MFFAEIPWLAVVIATIGNTFLGALWYSCLFGRLWADAYKLTPDLRKPSPIHYIGTLGVSFVMAFVLAGLSHFFHINTVSAAICLGFWIWLGLVATTHFSGVIWAQKPLKVFLIDTGYLLLGIVLMLTLFAVWT